jgi:hypothetical protein
LNNFDRFILAIIGLFTFLILLLIALGDQTYLEILEVNPPPGSQDVPLNSQITILFNRPINAKSIENNFNLNPPVEGYYSAVGRRFAFTPKYSLASETTYTLTLQKAAKDSGGREMRKDFTLHFSTKKQYLAYLSIEDGETGQVYRIHPSSGEKWSLTEPGEPVKAFDISPDGKILAYVVKTPDPLQSDKLYLKNLESGKKQEISILFNNLNSSESPDSTEPTGSKTLEISIPQFSPDARYSHNLGRSNRTESPWGKGLLGFIGMITQNGSAQSNWEVYLANLGESFPQAVKFEIGREINQAAASGLILEALIKAIVTIHLKQDSFRFSPDGNALVLRDKVGDFSLVTLTKDNITLLGPYLEVGNFNARGDQIAFVDVKPEDPELKGKILIHPSTGEIKEISDPSFDNMDPRFANRYPTKIVYAAGVKVSPGVKMYHLELLDLESKNRRNLSALLPPGESALYSDEHPVWSPDDQWIAFERFSREEIEKTSNPFLIKKIHKGGEIWMIKVDGSQVRTLGVRGTHLVWFL